MSDPVAAPNSDTDNQQAMMERLRLGIQWRATSLPWLARTAGVGLCVVSLALIGIFVFALGRHGLTLFVSNPPAVQIVSTLSYAVTLLEVGTMIGAIIAWRDRYWSRSARIHQTVLAVLGLAFVWQLFVLGFLF